jgi:hypothetical protein
MSVVNVSVVIIGIALLALFAKLVDERDNDEE